ncbi:MAG: NADH:flavin oxidoreductase, partial [Thermodesulfobacteriota bacterium]
ITGNLPSPMSRKDIKRVINDFAEAAARAKKAGFDAVEIHAAHGYLLSQFLSPYSNQRSDAYGGPIKKRARIIFEVFEAIREKVGKDFPILIKINASDFVESGLTSEDSLWVCERLSELGIDAIELSGGIPAALTLAAARKRILKPEKEAYFKEYAQALKPTITCPLILVGGVRSPEVMEEIFDSGTADMFSFARPLISEPELINRWMSGDTKPARCVSCNECLKAAHEEHKLYCVHFASEDRNK